MRILFFPANCCPFHGKSLEERPLGGAETAVIRLSEALHSFGQEVVVVSQEKEIPATNPRYVHFTEVDKLGLFDAVIVIRDWRGAFIPFNAKRIYFWTGDNWDNPHTYGIGDPRFSTHISALFPVSDWHAKILADTSGFPLEKMHVLRNGIHLPYFKGEETRRQRMIYTATPERGLVHLPDIFLELKAKHPNLELKVFSSFDRYKAQFPPWVSSDTPYFPIYEKLVKIPGCTLHESILQKDLAKEFMQASILAYPCNFEETSCISAMEAQAGGCPMVTSDLAALKETVGEAGVLIPGEPSSSSYRKKFIEACDQILSDPVSFERHSKKGKEQALKNDWKERAKGLLEYLKKEAV